MAFDPQSTALAWFATLTVASMGMLGIAMALASGGVLFRSPAPYAFNIITAVALLGVLTR